jgi:virulence-associated protein VagC
LQTLFETIVGHIAKLFWNGRSQAVRLPAEYRFDGDEVHVRRDPVTGDVVLSARADDWSAFFALVDRLGAADGSPRASAADHDPVG